MKTAKQIINKLKLQPHPEGGWYRQVFRDENEIEKRAISTSIYYLLEKHQTSHWHRIDAVEIWHYYAGAPIQLNISDGNSINKHILGADIFANQAPQIIVKKHQWQSAVSLGDWTLVGCTVALGFEFSGFELAPKGWSPDK